MASQGVLFTETLSSVQEPVLGKRKASPQITEEQRERYRASARKWKRNNPKRVKIQIDQWKKENPGKVRIHKARDYAKNKPSYVGRAKRRYQEIMEVVKVAKNVPCLDCGVRFPPSVMDFDHVRGTKSFAIGVYVSKNRGPRAIAAIKNEIEKCEVVCSNCHRLRTLKRRGSCLITA